LESEEPWCTKYGFGSEVGPPKNKKNTEKRKIKKKEND
jgi:hypothetical protein